MHCHISSLLKCLFQFDELAANWAAPLPKRSTRTSFIVLCMTPPLGVFASPPSSHLASEPELRAVLTFIFNQRSGGLRLLAMGVSWTSMMPAFNVTVLTKRGSSQALCLITFYSTVERMFHANHTQVRNSVFFYLDLG